MAFISQDILQQMFDPMPSQETDQINAQQQGANLQQNEDFVPAVTSPSDGFSVTETTTTPPPLAALKGDPSKRLVGGAKEQPYKGKKLYDANKEYISDVAKQIAQNNTEYATTIFQTLQKLPTVDGRTIPLSEFSSIFLRNSKQGKEILDQASQFADDPTFDINTSWELALNNWKTSLLMARQSNLKSIFRQNLASVAPQADALMSISKEDEYNLKQAKFNPHQLLFDENGNIRSEKEFRNAINKKRDELLETWNKEEKNVPLPTGGSWLRSDMPAQRPMYDLEGRIVGMRTGTNPSNYRESIEGYNDRMRNITSQKNLIIQTAKDISYNETFQTLQNAYNKEKSGGIYLGTEEEGKWKNQKGGEKQAVSQSIPFDYADAVIWEGQRDKKGKQLLSVHPNIAQVNKLIAGVLDNQIPDVKFSFNGVEGSVPSGKGINEDEYSKLINFLTDVTADFKQPGESDKDAQKRAKTLQLKGEVSFQGIVGGDNKYHAYTIKFNTNYLNRPEFSGGSETDKKFIKEFPEIKTQGITVYVPANISSQNLNLGIKHKQASTTSDVEALINTVGELPPIQFPGAGAIQLVKDPTTDSITVGGYGVKFDVDRFNYDTTHWENKKFPVGPDSDIDGFINSEILPRLQLYYTTNRTLKEQATALKGVKDPKQLQQQAGQ